MNVLIADDDAGSLLVARALVEAQGHRCRVAHDGEEAWRLYLEDRPDVLISDRDMPFLDGVSLCGRIRAQEVDGYTYIVLLTGHDSPGDVLTGMRAGADDYLGKPLDPNALEARLLAAERVATLHRQLDTAREELVRQARTDALTGLLNRVTLEDDLAAADKRAERYATGHCLAMCDLDHFKQYNDTYGHPAGDLALRTVAAILTAELRDVDRVYRYGGEEFLILFVDQGAEAAQVAADRVRRALQDAALRNPGAGPDGVLTLSIGLAESPSGAPVVGAELTRRADVALYEAKAAGRNRVTRAAGVRSS